MMENDWVKIYSALQIHQVQFAKKMLADNDVESFILNKQDSLYPMIGAIELFVSQKDVLRATHLISKYIDHE